jgi:hypothetical protein
MCVTLVAMFGYKCTQTAEMLVDYWPVSAVRCRLHSLCVLCMVLLLSVNTRSDNNWATRTVSCNMVSELAHIFCCFLQLQVLACTRGSQQQQQWKR